MNQRYLSLAILPLACLGIASAADPQPFEFLVMGCMPYHMPQDEERFANLTAVANDVQPAFTVHVGDTKSGQTPCDDAVYPLILERFNRFRHPLVYVPGDNEWTDCHTANAGRFEPTERLSLVRRMFFDGAKSLGVPALELESQSRAQPEFAAYVEQNRWAHQGIFFATLHVVGSNNGARESDAAAMEEFRSRDAASIAWMDAAFREAAKPEHRALVLFIHANPFANNTKATAPNGAGFANFVPALVGQVQAFGKPVYLFHADSHYFRIDKPLFSSTGRTLENFTRIETFGGHNLHLIRVRADATDAEPLVAQPMMIPANFVDPASPLPGK